MFLDYLNNLNLFDKIAIVFWGIILIVFFGIMFISKIKYIWERDELSEYLKKSYDDKNFKNLHDKDE